METEIGKQVWITCDSVNRGSWGFVGDEKDGPAYHWGAGFALAVGEKYLVRMEEFTRVVVKIIERSQPSDNEHGAIGVIVGESNGTPRLDWQGDMVRAGDKILTDWVHVGEKTEGE